MHAPRCIFCDRENAFMDPACAPSEQVAAEVEAAIKAHYAALQDEKDHQERMAKKT